MSINTTIEWTGYDQLMADQYATDMVLKEMCQDPDIKKQVCGDDTKECMEWKDDYGVRQIWDQAQPFTSGRKCDPADPNVVKKCNDGKPEYEPGPQTCIQNDIGENVCGFKMPNNRGYCVAKADGCDLASKLPYECKDEYNGCRFYPGKVHNYYEWRDDDKKCIYGNWALRQFCEEPGQRAPSTDNKTDIDPKKPPEYIDLPSSNETKSQGKMKYDKNVGKCYITDEYCKSFGNLWSLKGDVGPNSECDKPTWDKVLEFIVPPTFIQGIDNWVSGKGFCEGGHGGWANESYTSPVIDLKNLPDTISTLADFRYIKSKKLLLPNTVENDVHLYIVEWNNGGKEIAFDADEVKKVYPNLVKIRNGKKYIEIVKEAGRTNKALQRMFSLLSNKKSIPSILSKINK